MTKLCMDKHMKQVISSIMMDKMITLLSCSKLPSTYAH